MQQKILFLGFTCYILNLDCRVGVQIILNCISQCECLEILPENSCLCFSPQNADFRHEFLNYLSTTVIKFVRERFQQRAGKYSLV